VAEGGGAGRLPPPRRAQVLHELVRHVAQEAKQHAAGPVLAPPRAQILVHLQERPAALATPRPARRVRLATRRPQALALLVQRAGGFQEARALGRQGIAPLRAQWLLGHVRLLSSPLSPARAPSAASALKRMRSAPSSNRAPNGCRPTSARGRIRLRF